ncbi:unnamed protein product [Alternaria sp. RS040]
MTPSDAMMSSSWSNGYFVFNGATFIDEALEDATDEESNEIEARKRNNRQNWEDVHTTMSDSVPPTGA